MNLTYHDVRCKTCAKLLAHLVSAPWSIQCPRCGTTTQVLILATEEVITDSVKAGWRS